MRSVDTVCSRRWIRGGGFEGPMRAMSASTYSRSGSAGQTCAFDLEHLAPFEPHEPRVRHVERRREAGHTVGREPAGRKPNIGPKAHTRGVQFTVQPLDPRRERGPLDHKLEIADPSTKKRGVVFRPPPSPDRPLRSRPPRHPATLTRARPNRPPSHRCWGGARGVQSTPARDRARTIRRRCKPSGRWKTQAAGPM